MPSPAALDDAARKLRLEASGLDDLVNAVIDPIRSELPDIWVGPAADLFDEELGRHRTVISSTAGDLRTEAWRLEIEAQAARDSAAAAAAAAAPPSDPGDDPGTGGSSGGSGGGSGSYR